MESRSRGARPVRRRLARVVELAVPWGIGLLCAATALEPRGGGRQIAGVLLAAVMGGALAWRSQRPELVAAVVLAATVPYHLLVPELVIPFAGLAAIWSLTLARPPNVSLVGLAGLLAVSSINVFSTHAEEAVFTMALAFTVWVLAEAARHRVDAAHAAARQAAGEEKARIARELHDVIAHSVSVIVVQAGAAGDVFDTHPDQARSALLAIERTGREALVELRRLLGAVFPGELRSPSSPQPGLDRLDELAGQVRAAGLDVTVTVDGPPAALPAGIDLSAYRIVQEALTNTLRHARARSAEVTVRYRPDAVEIDVVDDGTAAPAASDGPGYGIIGMHERATVLGGTLDAAPTAHGGFRVHALLPLDPADTAVAADTVVAADVARDSVP
ncbi:MAG TPA: sensor histidine kinase [Acidimicrobiales bacterium]|nr:sensor histidine kinase [Acidimicrobiales bacterium]